MGVQGLAPRVITGAGQCAEVRHPTIFCRLLDHSIFRGFCSLCVPSPALRRTPHPTCKSVRKYRQNAGSASEQGPTGVLFVFFVSGDIGCAYQVFISSPMGLQSQRLRSFACARFFTTVLLPFVFLRAASNDILRTL